MFVYIPYHTETRWISLKLLLHNFSEKNIRKPYRSDTTFFMDRVENKLTPNWVSCSMAVWAAAFCELTPNWVSNNPCWSKCSIAVWAAAFSASFLCLNPPGAELYCTPFSVTVHLNWGRWSVPSFEVTYREIGENSSVCIVVTCFWTSCPRTKWRNQETQLRTKKPK